MRAFGISLAPGKLRALASKWSAQALFDVSSRKQQAADGGSFYFSRNCECFDEPNKLKGSEQRTERENKVHKVGMAEKLERVSVEFQRSKF